MQIAAPFFTNTRGLAPIVGTILMIGLVIVLGAVIGSQALSVETPDDHYERFKEIAYQNVEELPEDVIGWWNFDNNLNDISDYKNNGEKSGNIQYVDGVSGQAIRLDGNSYVKIPSTESLNVSDEITIISWVRWDITPVSGDNWANIVFKSENNGATHDGAYRLQHSQTNSQFEFAIETYIEGYDWLFGSSWVVAPSKNTWYHVACTYDGSEKVMYINGNKVGSENTNGKIKASDEKPLYIGSAGNSRYFTGTIDEVQIYERALSASEVSEIYESYLK